MQKAQPEIQHGFADVELTRELEQSGTGDFRISAKQAVLGFIYLTVPEKGSFFGGKISDLVF